MCKQKTVHLSYLSLVITRPACLHLYIVLYQNKAGSVSHAGSYCCDYVSIHRSNTVSYIICNETLMLSHTSPTRLDFFFCTVSNTVIYSAAILLLDQRISTCAGPGSGTVDIQLYISLHEGLDTHVTSALR